MANDKTVHKSLTFGIHTFDLVSKYANKYFQGNISAAICFIIVRYFEIENTGVTTSSSTFSQEQAPISKPMNTKHMIDLSSVLGGDK